MMEELEIKPVTAADLDTLHTLSRTTFTDAFAAQNTAADITLYLDTAFARERLAHELATDGSAFHFALLGEHVVGYLKTNTGQAQTEFQGNDALEIERIYVLQAFQGKRIGERLLEEALRIAADRNATTVWLGVWEKNTKAIAFYQRYGFIVFGRHLFQLGQDEQVDLLLRRSLRA
jgi:ribosomal protein S18 acetylase RimI-like enzyme